jgi:iron(III) transport system ATP-binding protein
VVHRYDDVAAVDVEDAVIHARSIGPLGVGDTTTVLVRPSASHITDIAQPRDPTAAAYLRHGTVIDVAYRGRGYDHVISVGRHRVSSVYDTRARQRGDQVTISLDADHTLAYYDPAGTRYGQTAVIVEE